MFNMFYYFLLLMYNYRVLLEFFFNMFLDDCLLWFSFLNFRFDFFKPKTDLIFQIWFF